MSRFLLSFRKQGTGGIVTPSDLVELGILTKQISEFSNDDIGTEVSIPYSNEGSGISGPIIFEVVGVNHHTTTEHPKTITLMTKNIIRKAAFDAAEPDNPDSMRKDNGNNRWSVSNIRQWLNSSGAAGKWFTAQHTYDAPPTTANVHGDETTDAAYADAPGFLAGFSANVLQHFTDITNITALYKVDNGGADGGSEETVDKVFLPSSTEMGLENNSEGSHLSIRYPDNNSRIKQWNGSNDVYYTRSPYAFMKSSLVLCVYPNGESSLSHIMASSGNGIAPIIVLH